MDKFELMERTRQFAVRVYKADLINKMKIVEEEADELVAIFT